MAHVNFFAISGLDEKTRHCYVLEINDDIYILNCGVENPITQTLGVSKIVPDMTYLVENQNRIRAIIIGTASMSNIGSLDILIQKIGSHIPIITNEISQSIIETFINTKYWKNNEKPEMTFILGHPMRDLILENDQVIVPFRIANSIPGSLGFVFKTQDGCVVFLDEYIIVNDQTKAFYSQLANIRDIIKGTPVLLMITPTGIVDKSMGFTSPNHNNKDFYEKIFSNTTNRIIVAVHDHDAYSIFALAQAAKKYQKNFVIYSRTFINTFQATIKAGLFNSKGLMSIPLDELNNSSNAVVVITGEPEKLFDKIYKIIDGEDPIIKFTPTDIFILGTKLIPGYEGYSSKLLDRISQIDIKTIVSPKTILPLEPSNEDHKFTASLIQPKYIIPISGLYKSFVQYQSIINQTWLKKDQVLILKNGEVVQLVNGVLVNKKETVPAEYIQMSSFGSSDISESVLYERNLMLENGAVCVSFVMNEKLCLVSELEIFDYGLLNHNDPIAMRAFEEIKSEIRNNIYTFFAFKSKTSIDFKETKINLKKGITKLFDKHLQKRPIVLTTIVDSKGNLREGNEKSNKTEK